MKTIGEMFDDELAAWNAAMDRKEAEIDQFGYGGDPSKPAATVVGLEVAVRPPREAYVRTSRPTVGGAFVEPGVEFRDGDDFRGIEHRLHMMLVDNDPGHGEHDPVRIAVPIEQAIKDHWPDRAYFVEVHGPTGWIQIFQPFGVPRNR